MQSLMEKISNQLYPHFGSFLNGPASIEEIEKAEQQIGAKFPKELKELYRIHNGNRDEIPGLFFGMAFLPLKEMVSEWLFSLEAAEAARAYEIRSYSVPKQAIKEQYFNKIWLPIAHDYGGNYLAVDLDPDKKGTYGQVINCGRNEEVKYVIAKSIKDFLEFISHTIEDGFYTIEEENMWSYGDVEYSHFFDGLKNMELPVLQAKSVNEKTPIPMPALDEEWKARISELSGTFERFTESKILYLGTKGIKDISPLASCTDAREVVLSGNGVSDLTPLQSMASLKRLYVGGNPIASLEPLSGLVNLHYLNIAHTPVTDAAPLVLLENLKELDMANTKIEDYQFLKQLVQLETLSVSIFSYQQLKQLAEVSGLKHLHIHQLAGVTHGDLILFAKLRNLQSLKIEQASFRNFSFLASKEKLKELTFVNCAIEDASELIKLPIEILECQNTPIDNLEVFAESPSLQSFAGNFQQFWTLKQMFSRPVDFSKITGEMTGSEEEMWISSLGEET